MKNLLLVLLLFVTSLNTRVLAETNPSKAIESLASSDYVNSLSKTTRTGTAKITGSLSEAQSSASIEDSALLVISLIGRSDENSPWEFIASENILSSAYEFNDLAAGDYYLAIRSHFPIDQSGVPVDLGDRSLYLPTLWNSSGDVVNSIFEITSEFIVKVEEGETISNIDFILEPAGVLVVTIDDSNSLGVVRDMLIINQGNQFFHPFLETATIGSSMPATAEFFYQFLPIGSYRFYIETDKYSLYERAEKAVNYIHGYGQCYDCALELLEGKGTEIIVEKFVITRIGSTFGTGATISGRLNLEDGQEDLEGVAHVYNTQGELVASASTCNLFYCSLDNEYILSGLAAGQYFMAFHADNHMRKLFNGADCPFLNCDFTKATPFRLKRNQHLQIKDINLQKSAKISGKILDSETGQALERDPSLVLGSATNFVEVYDENYNYKATGFNQGFSGFTISNQLQPGKYYLRTGSGIYGASNTNYINQIFDGVSCEGNNCDFSDAQLIDLTEQDSVTDIQITLQKGYRISGSVLDSQAQPIKNIEVAVHNLDGDLIANTKTKYDGSYKVGGLQPGGYYLRTYNGNKQNFKKFINEIVSDASGWNNKTFPNINCLNNSCPFTVQNSINITASDVTGIDFVLTKGSSIKGRVINASRSVGVADIEIKIFSETGNYIESYNSDEFGYFATAAMQSGNYRIITSNNKHYVNQAFGGMNCGLKECDPSESALINLTDSVDGINFSLIPGEDYFPGLSGMWYNSEQSGHGLQFEVIKSQDKASLLVSWYVVQNGEPMWLTGVGPLNKDMAFIDLSITSGADFPPNFNTNDVEKVAWGQLRVEFNDLNNAELFWNTEYDGFESGNLTVERLTSISKAIKNNSEIDACLSGSFYNPDQSGHGIMLEVLGEDADTMLITWYTYVNGNQIWFLAVGPVDGTHANQLPVIYVKGTNFPPNFMSTDVRKIPWGSFSVSKIDNDNIKLDWLPNAENLNFGSGSINLKRLTTIADTVGCGSL